ncbi:MAG: hypothetical protein RLP44_15580 [Aggregatilineales bacterium]
MDVVSINQFLTLYTWFILAALLLLMLLIARFYQQFSGERTYFWLYLVPIVCFGVAAVRYTSIERIAHDPYADFILAIGGVVLIFLSIRIYWLMIYRKRHQQTS